LVVMANVLVGLIAALHIYFLVLEMFLWTKPLGLKIFTQTYERAKDSAVLAANQGLYNGFLAAGLIWGLAHQDADFAFQIKLFFLGCVLVAGLFGGIVAHKKIFFIQALPALVAIFLLLSSCLSTAS